MDMGTDSTGMQRMHTYIHRRKLQDVLPAAILYSLRRSVKLVSVTTRMRDALSMASVRAEVVAPFVLCLADEALLWNG